MARPTLLVCTDCGTDRPVSTRGQVPTSCAECGGDLADPAAGETRVETSPAPGAARMKDEPGPDAGVRFDDRVRRIAPIVWVDDRGRRFSSHAAAVAALQADERTR